MISRSRRTRGIARTATVRGRKHVWRIALVLSVFCCLVAAPPAGATTSFPPSPTLNGTHIGPFMGTITLPASQPSYWHSGWIWPVFVGNAVDPRPFVTWTTQQQLGFINANIWRNELWIAAPGGTLTRVPLTHGVFITPNDPAEFGDMSISEFDWTNFPANTFAPGTYTFDSRWYGDPSIVGGSVPSLERIFTVIFT